MMVDNRQSVDSGSGVFCLGFIKFFVVCFMDSVIPMSVSASDW